MVFGGQFLLCQTNFTNTLLGKQVPSLSDGYGKEEFTASILLIGYTGMWASFCTELAV